MDNYSTNADGVIFQIERKPFNYEEHYIEKIYPGDEHKFKYTNYLRLGYVIGAFGKIPQSILEVGYGKGYFLEAAKEIIPNVYGYDVTDIPVPAQCKKVTEEQFLHDHYDVIVFWDALEHFEDIEFVKNLNCKTIFISLPWCHYRSMLWEGTYTADNWFATWKHRKPDEHLWHFDDFSLPNFMKRMGYDYLHIPFNIEDTTRKGVSKIPNILTCAFTKIEK